MRALKTEAGRAPWWALATASVATLAIVVTGLPASAEPTPSPEPSATTAPEPSPAPVDAAQEPYDFTQNTAGSSDATDGDAAEDGASALVVDGDVDVVDDQGAPVPAQVVPDAGDPESAAASDLFDTAEVVAPPATDEVLTVETGSALDAKVAERANVPASATDSIVVGVARAPLGDLAGALYGDSASSTLTQGRPDLLASALPRVATGDDVAIEVTSQLTNGGIPGAAFAAEVSLADSFDAAWVDAAFDASGVANAYGGDYGDRLSLMVLPECALTTPQVQGCLVGVPLETDHQGDGILRAFVPAGALGVLDVAGRTGATHLVDLGTGELVSGLAAAAPTGRSIIAAVSGADSQAGSFKATDLAPRGTWGVTEPAGGFTYSIPVTTPPVSAGSSPSVSLNYSSQATDGKTSASNSQSGVIGEGWSMPVSYIERLYKPCTDDGGTTPGLCWDSPYTNAPGEAAYVMSLQGSVEELVYVGPGPSTYSSIYQAVSDPTLKVTRFFGADGRNGNGDDDFEYFKVQTNDGSVYYFGYNPVTTAVPGGTTAPTKSIAYEPVVGNNTWEAGNGAAGNLIANQAYRFMLDLAVDSNSNASTYFYTPATNKTLVAGVKKDYVRDLQLSRIEYGQTFDAATSTVTAPEAKVEFNLVNRCVTGAQFRDDLSPLVDVAGDCADGPSSTNAASYPDVPVDLICTETSCSPNATAPTYFSTVRLNQITTSVVGDAAKPWVAVETTQLITAFPTTKDGSARSLWLDSVYTRGWGAAEAPNATQVDDVDTYLTKFSGIRLNNRVDWDMTVGTNKVPQRPMDRMRISNVFTDLGGRIDVTYAQADEYVAGAPVDKSATRTGALGTQVCPQAGKTGPDYAAWLAANPLSKTNSAANNQLCFAVKSGSDTFLYHNYVVTKVELKDLVGGQPAETHAYAYGGSPAYTRADSVLYAVGGTGDTTTFSSYRGFLSVSSTVGNVAPSVLPVSSSTVVPAANLRTGDFDGDGRTDLFTADASGQWKYSKDGSGPWVNLGSDATVPLADLRFGDFNGDGKTDVFSRTSAGQWRYSASAAGGWTNLTSDSGTPLADLRFADFNGDNKTDIFSRTAAGQWRYSAGGTAGYLNIASEGATPISDLRFGDFNGDGKDDVFARTASGQWVYSSGGALSYVNLAGDGSVPLAALQFADVNGDGKTDVVTQNADGSWKFSAGGVALWAALGAPTDAPASGTTLTDFTGDGRADLLVQDASGGRRLWENGDAGWTAMVAPAGTVPTPTTRAVSTNQYFRGTGATLASLHDGSARPDADPRLQGMLESSKTVDGSGLTVGTSKPTYTVTPLSTPTWDRGGTVPVPADHNPYIVQSTQGVGTTYDGSWSVTTTSTTVFDPITRQPTEATTSVKDNLTLVTKTTCQATDYASTASPYMVVAVGSRGYDGVCGVGGILTSKVELGYDGGAPGSTTQPLTKGLVKIERAYSVVSVDATLSKYTTSKAAYDDRGRIVKAWMPKDLPQPEALTDPTTPATVTWAYDKEGAAWTTTVTRTPGSNLETTSKTWTERGHGNTLKTQGATAGDTTYYQYDALGLMTGGWAPGQWTQAGTPTLATSIPTIMYRYDIYASGPTLRTTPAVITTAPFVGDTGTAFPASTLTGTARRSMTFLDGFGRAIEQQAVAPDGKGGRTVTATRYNALGQVDWTSAPFAASGELRVLSTTGATMLVNPALASLPAATDFAYDTLGRTRTVASLVNGAQLSVGGVQAKSTTWYAGLSTTTYVSDGSGVSTNLDVLGRTVSKVVRPDTANSSLPVQRTTYTYATLSAAGKVGFQQVTVKDPEGKSTVFESNLAGQRTQMVDPNAGTTTYHYDANGLTDSVTSPAGTITMGYDALGRLTSRDTGGSSSATWDYVTLSDVAGADPLSPAQDLGLLKASESTTRIPNISVNGAAPATLELTTKTEIDYDGLHRPVKSIVTLPDSSLLGDLSGKSYTTTTGYDAIGQPTTAGFQAMGGLPEETVSTGYSKSGSAQTLKLTQGGVDTPLVTASSTPLVTGVNYSNTGQMLSRTYGNGVTRAYGWDASTRALTGLTASFVTNESGSDQTVFVQKDSFTRDVMGRITQSTNEIPVADGTAADGQVTAECFAYDGFNRLASAWTVAGSGAAACGGSAPFDYSATGWDASNTAYAAQWSYSPGGRITKLIEGAGDLAVTSAFAYDDDAAHPAAVTSVTRTQADQIAYEAFAPYGDDSFWAGPPVVTNEDQATASSDDEYLFFTGGVGGAAGTEWTRPLTSKGQKAGELKLDVTVPEVAPAADDTLTIKVSDAANPQRSVSLTITGAEAATPAGPGLPHRATLDLAGVLPADQLVVSISAQQSSSAGVHGAFAVDYLETDLSANGVDTFAYDAAGRMTSRDVDGVPTALTWDVTSSLVESNGQGGHVVYAYDASGQRVAQARVADAKGVGTATAYVASGQVDDPNTAATNPGDLTATRYYTFGGSTVAIRTNDGNLSLVLGDEQGSTSVVMPVHEVAAAGQVPAHLAPATLADASDITRTSYTPYGELRGADNLATDRGWLGQVEDRVDGATGTGLTYLNARYYDPTTMRFISPDPLLNPGDPRTLDPYRYANNNPVMFTDATGLNPFSDVVSGFYSAAGSVATEWWDHSVYNAALDWDGFYSTWSSDVSEYRVGAKENGAWTQLNLTFNPVLQLMMAADATVTAVQQGDWKGAGSSYFSTLMAAASTAAIAYGGAKFVSSKLPTGSTVLAPEAAAPKPQVTASEQLANLKTTLEQAKYPSTTLTNVTKPGSSPLNFRVQTTFREVADTLKSGGYQETPLGNGKMSYLNGQKRYTYYPNATSGGPTLQVAINGVVRAKIRLKAV